MKITIQDARTSVTLQQRDFRVTISGARGPAGPQGDPGEGGEWGTIVGDITEQTDLYNALQAKVPYTGATQDVNLGEYGAQLGNLEFDNTPTNVPTTAGSVYWNDTDGTLNIVLKGGQTISRVGETQHIRALNNTGAQIARGKVVYVVGAQGQRLTIGLADADTEILSKDTIGFTAEAIADGAEGFVIVQGVINNVSTTGMTDGATVYLSQTAGGYTTTAPIDPAHMVVLGFIVNGGSGGAGSIYVKVDNGYELEELHGVADAAKVTPVGADALLLRDSADNNLWKRLTWTNALAGVKSHMDTFKSVAGGYASLDGSGKVPASELPSYVDDVLEVASFASLPVTGENGKIYVTLDTNKCYRWTGSVYVEVSAGGASAWGAITGTLSNQTDLQTALDGKVDENSPITGATKTKITYDAKGLVTAGADAAIADITGLQTALDDKQATLSLTTTGTSGAATLVGSTLNIPQYQGVLTNPVTGTGTAGQVAYFSGTSVVTGGNLLFENTGKTIYFNGGTGNIGYTNNSRTITFNDGNSGIAYQAFGGHRLLVWNQSTYLNAIVATGNTTTPNVGIFVDAPSARLHVRGSGTTSATTALLVQNSTPTALLTVRDDGRIQQTIPGASGNTIFGTSAGNSSSLSGEENTFFGNSAGLSVTTGAYNTFFGNNAGRSITTANSNSFFGRYAGYYNSTGFSNCLFGLSSGLNNTTGGNNVLIGTSAGRFIQSGSNLTIINDSVFIGFDTRAAADSQTNQIVIGHQASGNGSNTATLGNTSIVATYLRGDINYTDGGNFVIGTTTGTKIGTATSQKIGFYNATPVVQRTTTSGASTLVGGGGTALTDTDTFDGYTLATVVKALRDLGLLA